MTFLLIYSITISDYRLGNITTESIKVEPRKQSIFIQIHVVAETIMRLQVPLLYEVPCFISFSYLQAIIPEDTYFYINDHSVIVVLKKKISNPWPRLQLIVEGEARTTRSRSCFQSNQLFYFDSFLF